MFHIDNTHCDIIIVDFDCSPLVKSRSQYFDICLSTCRAARVTGLHSTRPMIILSSPNKQGHSIERARPLRFDQMDECEKTTYQKLHPPLLFSDCTSLTACVSCLRAQQQ